ncbi:PH domain-containing protein [Gordonia jinghuaiqii]|uniref:PH domain-containing protein n=1 Tax=Gordonia jinghuaiqii TaxID=2758710 RepID=A0A7D7LRM3_9ACTN|nr:PH domain-containing protein [Gordonia jinghuaiqii]MCR5976695.1 PH domain-containing protein [Gordonia jinghuaiqii]QMS99876.1 PH domain-containing protein [Gordonia jinghuaiqii]
MGIMNGMMGNAGRIDPRQGQAEYAKLLGQGETVDAGYRLVRDVFLFTNRRLLLIDKQGITGKKTEYHSIPYRSVTHFSVETAGTFDLDAELKIWLSGTTHPIARQFNRQVDIYELQAILAHYIVG